MAGSLTAIGRPALVTVPTPLPAWKVMVGWVWGLDFRDDERTVGYVRVVACVLYDTRGAVGFVFFPVRYGKGRLFALWQSY